LKQKEKTSAGKIVGFKQNTERHLRAYIQRAEREIEETFKKFSEEVGGYLGRANDSMRDY
jgi:vacuolar-type H+-ATPase subunit H